MTGPIRLQLDGAVYCFALPDGGWGALYPGSHVMTSEGRVELPGEDVLGLVGTRWQGRLCMAGQGGQSGQAWLYTGRWTATGLTFGVSPCAFGGGFLFTVASGASYRRLGLVSGETVEIAAQMGTQGIRYVDGAAPVSGDATYRNGELFEWTRREDLVCGQGHFGGALLNGMEIEPGDCRFIRFARAGEKLGIGIVKLVERCAVLHWLSVAELQERPPKEPPTEPPDVPAPIPPATPNVPPAPHGGSMRVYLRQGSHYIGIAPNTTNVYADRPAGGAWEEVELRQRAGGLFDALFVAADRQLSLTPGGLESRPADTGGAWELAYATTQPDGSSLLYRVEDGVLVAPVLQIEDAS